MAYDMSGTLGKNQYQKNDSQPSHTGKCTINGEDFRIAAWVKQGEDGKFFALKFSRKEDAPKKEAAEVIQPEIDDEIPF